LLVPILTSWVGSIELLLKSCGLAGRKVEDMEGTTSTCCSRDLAEPKVNLAINIEKKALITAATMIVISNFCFIGQPFGLWRSFALVDKMSAP